MGRSASKSPVNHIVSVRVSESEYEKLKETAKQLGVNLSTLLRKSLQLEAFSGKSDLRERV